MSISGAMNTAVSALKAQAQALSTISHNLANSGTTGYKAVTTSFSDLVTQQYSGTNYNGAGVMASSRQNVSNQGKIESTSNSNDLALDGNGMFVVRAGTDNSSIYFSRNGEFEVNKSGYMVNGNYYLMGWPTNPDGSLAVDPAASSLQKINVTNNVSSVSPTTTLAIDAGLNPDAATGAAASQNTTVEVYDSLGNAHTLKLNWQKTGPGAWTLTVNNPDAATLPQTFTQNLTFDGAGNLVTPAAPSIWNITATWNDGANASPIAVDLSSLTQTLGGTNVVEQTSFTADGHSEGKLLGVTVDKTGMVTASYDNGQSIPIYRVPVATFPNYNGLSATSHGIYQQSSTSGNYTLHIAGDGGSATITASALESSTVDTAEEFTHMIVAQQAYSAASQVITTSKNMYESLIGAIR